MLIIPAIDIIDNKVVRLAEGDYNKSTVYENTPLKQAEIYNQHGFKWIHIVDLLGSKSGEILGSISINNKEEFEQIVKKHGDEKIITAIDVKDEYIAIKGWTEKSTTHVSEHLKYCSSLGLKTFLCTDISKDGLLKGTSNQVYKKL